MSAVAQSNHVLPLGFLQSDECACICEISGDQQAVHRLAEMGIRHGARMKMVQPGLPCIVAIDGRRFSLRLDGSVEIFVQAPL